MAGSLVCRRKIIGHNSASVQASLQITDGHSGTLLASNASGAECARDHLIDSATAFR